MSDYDRLKGQAESLFGKDAVDRIERQIKAETQGGGVKPQRLFGAENVELRVEPPREIKKVDAVHSDSVGESKPITATTDKVAYRSPAATLMASAIRGEYIYGMLGLVLGLAAIIGGVILALHGVAGSTSWTAKVLGLESKINDAAPGVVLFIVGLFMIWVTKPTVRMKDIRDV